MCKSQLRLCQLWCLIFSIKRIFYSIITCYTNDAGKTHNHENFEMWTCWGKMAAGKLAYQTINHHHHKIFFYYGHLCHRRIGVYMKHTVRIMNILSDYELS